MTAPAIRVILADDERLVRAGFRMILGSEPGIAIVAEAADGREAVAAARSVPSDVVLMDIRMPGLDGLAATRQIRDHAGDRPRVIVLTTFDLDEYVFEALRAGASGFLLKDAPEERLIAAIRVAADGGSLYAPSVTRRLIERFAVPPPPDAARPELGRLTPRELEVLGLVARGLSNAEIAETLVVSEHTAKTHVAHILDKLDLRDRVQAVVLAYESGLVEAGRARRLRTGPGRRARRQRAAARRGMLGRHRAHAGGASQRGTRMTQDSRVAVIGLGYVGLPLAIAFAESGLDVQGVDVSADRIAMLGARRSPIDDISDERLGAALDGKLTVATQADALLAQADAVFVCVPTPINATKDPDLGPVLAAAEYIRDHVRAGQLIVLQSTTYPGTTVGPFRTVLEASGLRAGVDFDLAYAPERVNPGDPASAMRTVPRLVGGLTPAATARAAALLACINDQVVELTSPDAAELAKLLENVFRNVNIAFVNQLALLCERMGLDVWEVIDAAATKPFGFMRFTPGPGVGGHCIPVDPYYLSWRAREFDFIDRFIELAGDINLAMPRHVVDLVGEALNDRGRALKGARVGVVGVAFKPDVRDDRNSPAAEVITGLTERGAEVRFHDPHVARFKDSAGVVRDGETFDALLDWADVVVVVTAHRAVDWTRLYRTASLVVDAVNSSHGQAVSERQVLRLGAGWLPSPVAVG